jgi:hypothetical protein
VWKSRQHCVSKDDKTNLDGVIYVFLVAFVETKDSKILSTSWTATCSISLHHSDQRASDRDSFVSNQADGALIKFMRGLPGSSNQCFSCSFRAGVFQLILWIVIFRPSPLMAHRQLPERYKRALDSWYFLRS